QGDNDLARVEFNRALDRQRRAKERFAEEIAVDHNGIKFLHCEVGSCDTATGRKLHGKSLKTKT
ncbi:MAG TPA: hypothetical protein EYN35_07555, partial [Methylococcales bacterium]|nr:hypothetical protein [Methylococcales bacterium]